MFVQAILRRRLFPVLLTALLWGSSAACLYNAPDGELPDASVLASLAGLTSGAASNSTTPDPAGTTTSTISRFVAVGTAGIALYSDDAGVTWTDSSPSGGDLFSVAFGNNVFVAVGNGGRVLRSADGTSWTDFSPGTGNALKGVAFGGGVFVVVGDVGTIYYSTDGANWTDVSPRGNNLKGVAYGGGRFVAAGVGGHVYWSADGITWNLVVIGTTPVGGLEYIAYGGGRFIAVAQKTVADHQSYWSTDGGVTWNFVTVPTQKASVQGLVSGIGYGAGRWFTVEWKGFNSYSADGTSWTGAGDVGDPRGFATDGTNIIGVGFHTGPGNMAGVTYSTDGINWTEIATPPGSTALWGVVHATLTP